MNTARELKSDLHLPSLPHVLLRLIEACDNDETSTNELAEIISSDPAVAGKVIALGNSAYFGLAGKLQTVDRVVVHLGRAAIKNLVLSTSILEAFSQVKPTPSFRLDEFWRHSFQCAATARLLAQAVEIPQKEEAFLAGLLHDIGKLIFVVQPGHAYEEPGPARVSLEEPLQKEMETFGCDHAEAGNFFLEQNGFSTLTADAVLHHHQSRARIEGALDLSRIIWTANLLSQTDPALKESGLNAAGSLFELSRETVLAIMEQAGTELQETAQAFGLEFAAEGENEGSPFQEEKREEMLGAVRDQALLLGVLNSLVEADDQEKIIRVIHHGSRILFDLSKIIVFIHEPGTEKLIAAPLGSKPTSRAAHLKISLRRSETLPAKAFKTQRPCSSFAVKAGELTIADEQIIRLMGAEGLFCFPVSARDARVGVIAAGLSESEAENLAAKKKLLKIFTKQIGLCLHLQKFKQNQTSRIIQERMEASSAMARMVVHETNNPLGIIRNYISILANKLGPEGQVGEELRILKEELERVRQIIKRLILVNPDQQSPEPLDISKGVRDIMKLLNSSLLVPAGVKLTLSLPPSLPPVRAEGAKIIQIVTNLVKNAVEAMPEGGGITIAAKPSEDGRQVLLFFKDDGPGLPDSIRTRLFEPGRSTKGKDHFGLGLSIVRNLVAEMNGVIDCRTDQEKGTTFIIQLPSTSPEDAEGAGAGS